MQNSGVAVDRMIEQRDVDAALYLLSRMLGAADSPQFRRHLMDLRNRLEVRRSLSEQEREEIVSAYYEVVG